MTSRQVGTQLKEMLFGSLHTVELPASAGRLGWSVYSGSDRGWSWGQSWAGHLSLGYSTSFVSTHVVGERPEEPSGPAHRGDHPGGYLWVYKGRSCYIVLIEKAFSPTQSEHPEGRWCDRVTDSKALFIKKHEAALKPCSQDVAVMDEGPCPVWLRGLREVSCQVAGLRGILVSQEESLG